MSHYHLIPIEAKQLFSSILVVFKIKLRKLCYTGVTAARTQLHHPWLSLLNFQKISKIEAEKSNYLKNVTYLYRDHIFQFEGNLINSANLIIARVY